jgi:hypothetical protein
MTVARQNITMITTFRKSDKNSLDRRTDGNRSSRKINALYKTVITSQIIINAAGWRFRSSEVWRCVFRRVLHDVSKYRTVFSFTVLMSPWAAWPWKWRYKDLSKRRKALARRHSSRPLTQTKTLENLLYRAAWFWCNPPNVNSPPKSKHLDVETIKT